jgi:heterotetrameric sarcosine oxidase gamma subunit
MAEQTVRISALKGHALPGHQGAEGAGVTIKEVPDLTLWQMAAWADTIDSAASMMAQQVGVNEVPGFAQARGDHRCAVLRIEPLKFWVFGGSISSDSSEQSVVLDLSHSRTHLRLTGANAVQVLNSYMPLDLRDQSFPVNSVASTAFHHVGVTLWRSDAGYELFLPRGFALSLWELLRDASLQFGLMVE